MMPLPYVITQHRYHHLMNFTMSLQAQEAEFGVNFNAPDLENGPTNPLSLKRTFGSTEPIRVKLYRDHAGAQQQQHLQQQQQLVLPIQQLQQQHRGSSGSSSSGSVAVVAAAAPRQEAICGDYSGAWRQQELL
jgi:hypothetical protein